MHNVAQETKSISRQKYYSLIATELYRFAMRRVYRVIVYRVLIAYLNIFSSVLVLLLMGPLTLKCKKKKKDFW